MGNWIPILFGMEETQVLGVFESKTDQEGDRRGRN